MHRRAGGLVCVGPERYDSNMCTSQAFESPAGPSAPGLVANGLAEAEWLDSDQWEQWEEECEAGDVLAASDGERGRGDAEVQRSPWQRMMRVFPFDPRPVDASDVADSDLLGVLREGEAMISQIAARQAQALVELRRRRLVGQAAAHPHPDGVCPGACCDDDGWVATEVGAQMGLSDRQVAGRIDTALLLSRHLAVATALSSGQVQSWTATRLLDHLSTLSTYVSDDRLAEVERATVAWLLTKPRTVGQLNARMRRLILAARAAARGGAACDPAPPGHADRGVSITPASTPGLAELVALLPEADALAIRATLQALGHDPVDAHDPRSAQQRQADLLVTMVTGSPGLCGRAEDGRCALHPPVQIQVRLDVTVPVDSLSGGPQPARVPGYGDLPAASAREVTTGAWGGTCSARPLVYDPATGRLLGLGAGGVRMVWVDELPAGRGYEHSATLDAAVRLRDGTCRAPGCLRPAARCDCDHVVPYPNGPTTLSNSCSLCRRHHRLKTHAPGWAMSMRADGEVTWTTPTGWQVTTHPYDYRPPQDGPLPDPDPPPF